MTTQTTATRTSKSTTYIKEFSNEREANNWMVMKNQTQRDGSIFCLVPGATLDYAVVDLMTAIELGLGYTINYSRYWGQE